MVVDDEPIILDLLDNAFSKVGYSVFLATNADPEAIIYALTGYAGLFGPREMLEAGFDDYFAKPISLKDLYRAVKESFEKLDNLDNFSRVFL